MDDLKMRVVSRRTLTEHICEFTLRALDEAQLPAFKPGAHVTIKTPVGAMRRYSLINDGAAPDEYRIAIKREAASRGGSASMHDDAPEGTELLVQPPENSFPLENANAYLLIAGGIGVTPIYAMAQHLKRQDKPFSVVYCTRSRADTAYVEDMEQAFGDRLLVHHDDGDPERAYDFWDHFEEPQDMRVYCCGPQPLIDEIKAVSGHWPEGRVTFEDFKPVEVVRDDDSAFEVTLERSGTTLTVPEDRSILEALRDAGVSTTSSCESGTCGTCKTRLIAGNPDHRDMVLRDDEQSDHIMICVSRAKDGGLVLDL